MPSSTEYAGKYQIDALWDTLQLVLLFYGPHILLSSHGLFILRITGESGDFWMAMSWNAETSSYIWSYNSQNVSDGFQNWQYGR